MEELKLEDLGFNVSTSSEGSAKTTESFQFCRSALIEVYNEHLSKQEFKTELKNNVIYVNTKEAIRFVDLKQINDILVYPENQLNLVPVESFKICVEYNAPTISELVTVISNIQQEKAKNSSENSSKRLPFIIVFNGTDLSDIETIKEQAKTVKDLIAIIWCNASLQ